MRRSFRRSLALAALLVGSGCLPSHQQTPAAVVPTAESEWPAAYERAMANARESRFAAADQVLLDFTRRFPTSPEAAEVPYWRAVLKLDPSNPTVLRESLAMLETYLTGTTAGRHRVEAAVIQRLGVALEARNAALAAIPPMATLVRPEEKAAQEQEMQRLRDELGKANAELARIRRRLARPRP